MKDEIKNSKGQFLVYKAEDGTVKIDVKLSDETVWLTQKLMAELFQTSIPNINMHLKNIFSEGELKESSTIKDFLIVQKEGKREVKRKQVFYNLDAIISVGYRIKSHVATRFRIWATERLKEYIVKGFTLDDERLKNPDLPFDYFEELTRRIQDIRTSERRFYQKITDIYATSVDYDPFTLIAHQHANFTSDDSAIHNGATTGSVNLNKQIQEIKQGKSVRLSEYAHLGESGQPYFQNKLGQIF